MSWNEFCTLLSGLLPDTPLGRIVSIRAEKDLQVLKNFSPDQKKIRSDWQRRKLQRMKENPETYRRYVDQFQAFCKAAFSNEQ